MFQNLIGKNVIYVEVDGLNYIFPNMDKFNEYKILEGWKKKNIEVSDRGVITYIDECDDSIVPNYIIVETKCNGNCQLKNYGLYDFNEFF